MSAHTLSIIGIMSGSSMDGLDIALCQFSFDSNNQNIRYQILQSYTQTYPDNIITILKKIRFVSAQEFFEYDVIYGRWIGQCVHQWLTTNHLHADAIAVHGHTVFHYPQKGYSIQLGNAAQIAAICNLPVIHNFRNLDIAYGGQGAPLVPIGDKLLFPDMDACINIGGIANVFLSHSLQAYDICIANMALNHFAQQIQLPYDANGQIASKGQVHQNLLHALNELPFMHQPPPKTLNREYFENNYLPLIHSYKLSISDILATLCEHIAIQIVQSIQQDNIKKVLITGGGAYHQHLIKRIIFYTPNKQIIIPNDDIIQFKEALIFALLGYLRIMNIPNVISHATGAAKDTISGDITNG